MDNPDPFRDDRARMLNEHLAGRGITCPRVLSAMEKVPRHQFVAAGKQHLAYQDQALGIDCSQTISQPYIVAAMSQALELSADHQVLEIGTGSGYQAAVLAELAGRVISIERHHVLYEAAAERLVRLGYENIELLLGDGSRGYPAEAPYQRIMITAAGRDLPDVIWDQLAEGGVLVAPLGGGKVQQLTQITKRQGKPARKVLMDCRFVPLVAEAE
jgi:protein-L-isoaspartate(D-aspartate) O-methyltransferase